MQRSDLFLFTSVAEGTPHVILESIGNNLPILCFDICGHGDSVNDSVGIKIPLTTPQRSVIDFAEKMEFLCNNRQILKNMSQNCKKRSEELSWDNKAKQLITLYNQILKG